MKMMRYEHDGNVAHFGRIDFLLEKWKAIWTANPRDFNHTYEKLVAWCRSEGMEFATKRDKTIMFGKEEDLVLFLLKWR